MTRCLVRRLLRGASMSSTLTCYGWSFGGHPTSQISECDPAWIALPGTARRLAVRAITALHRTTSPLATVYQCDGELDGNAFKCDAFERVLEDDVSAALQMFARYCARSVAHHWSPDPIVAHWLATGDDRLRGYAHQSSWATSIELVELARIAARVTMYASQDSLIASAAREASRLALQVYQAGSHSEWCRAVVAQERVLSAAILHGSEHAERRCA